MIKLFRKIWSRTVWLVTFPIFLTLLSLSLVIVIGWLLYLLTSTALLSVFDWGYYSREIAPKLNKGEDK